LAASDRSLSIDGDAGVLLYRGYPIEQLAQHCDFLEVCYLLLKRRAARPQAENEFVASSRITPWCTNSWRGCTRGPARRAPDGSVVGRYGALSAFYHDALGYQ